jgi:hypothetical protein
MDCSKAVGVVALVCLWTSSAFGGPFDRTFPSGGLVSRWSGEGDAKDSTGRHNGRVVGAVKYVKGMSGRAFGLDGRAYIDMGNPAGLRITGSQTIAMWVKPARLGVRQNPLAKAVGGEGVINIEPTGRVNYYYGVSGGRNVPYDAIGSASGIKVGKWTHIALVRDFKARKLRWYIDGVLKSEKVPKFANAKASSTSLYIGKGYVENFSGSIDEVCIWGRALTAAEISAVASSVSFTAPQISRNAKLDIVRPVDGSVLLGTIENQDWSITTSYGKFKIPVASVVGFVANPGPGAATSRPAVPDVKMLLVDSQVLAGRLTAPLVRLKLAEGQVLKIPVAMIKQCGYRIGPKKPAIEGHAARADAKFSATVVLRGGDQLVWDSSKATIRFKSACGTLAFRPEIISTIAAAGDNTWRVNLKDSSVIIGAPAAAALKLKLKLGKEISVPFGNVSSLTFPGVPVKPTDATGVLLSSGDRLVGEVQDKQLAVKTDHGTVDVAIAKIWKIVRHADGKADLTMQSLTVLRGKLSDGSLAMILGSGVKLDVPLGRVNSITFPRKLPADHVAKIEALVKELGDASAAKRNAASQKLIAMGKDILVVLKRPRAVAGGQVANGVKKVIDTLEGKPAPIILRRGVAADGVQLIFEEGNLPIIHK